MQIDVNVACLDKDLIYTCRGDAAAASREKVVPTRAPAWNFNRDWDQYNFRSDRSHRSQFVRSFPEENKYRWLNL